MAPRRARTFHRPPIDQQSAAQAFSHEGIDPRDWLSVGHVDGGNDAVSFDPDLGYLIAVTLEPSGKGALCRLCMQVAGDGEGDFHPFVEGDAVLVGMLGGSAKDALILGRLTSTRAPMPSKSVGGQDPTKNAFGYTRRRTPYIAENAGPMMLREATSQAFLSIDAKGVVTLRDGQKAALQMTPDAFGYQSGDAKALLQLDLTGGRFTLQVNDALLTLSSSHASPEVSAIGVPGQLSITTASNPAAEHAVSTEALFNILAQWTQQLAAAITLALPAAIVAPAAGAPLGPLIGGPLALVFSNPGSLTGLLPAVAAAASVAPQDHTLAQALAAAFLAAQQKPAGAPAIGQLKPGIGSPGLIIG